MGRYLLDTNEVILYLRGHAAIQALLRRSWAAGAELCTCATVVAEVAQGTHPHQQDATREVLESFHFLDEDRACAELAGTLVFRMRQKHHTLLLDDCRIAAVALSHGAVIVTENLKDFRPLQAIQTDLQVIDQAGFAEAPS